jgi:hypothetical protein
MSFGYGALVYSPNFLQLLVITLYCQLYCIGILNAQTQLRQAFKVRGLAHKKHWRPDRQSFHTGWVLLAAALNGLYYWFNVS